MSDPRTEDSRPAKPGATMDPAIVGRPVAGSAPASTTAAPRAGARRQLQWKVWAQRYGALGALVVLFVYNAIDTPFFLTPQSLLFVLLRQAAPIAIVAVGMAIVIGTAGIDLSVRPGLAIARQGGGSPGLHGRPLLPG